MKKILFGLVIAIALVGCSNNGKKITIDGSKGEVYYKGDGVTEKDAQKLGDYLKTEGYFDNETTKSVQLMKAKEGDGYDVHFVVDEKKAKETPTIEDIFRGIGVAISSSVFGGKPVNVYLSDKSLKDFMTFMYDKKKTEELVDGPTKPTEENGKLSLSDAKNWDHDKAGGVTFYWNGMSDDESKRIADYIVKNGAFGGGGTPELLLNVEGQRTIIRFPMLEAARNDASYIAAVEKVSKEIKDNLFADAPYSFYITDENLATVKAYDY